MDNPLDRFLKKLEEQDAWLETTIPDWPGAQTQEFANALRKRADLVLAIAELISGECGPAPVLDVILLEALQRVRSRGERLITMALARRRAVQVEHVRATRIQPRYSLREPSFACEL